MKLYSVVLVFSTLLVLAISGSSCNPASGHYTLDHHSMVGSPGLQWEQDSTVLVFAGNAALPTAPLALTKGKYTIRFSANGTIAGGVLPHFAIHFGDYFINDFNVAAGLHEYKANFELLQDMKAPLVFSFDNDSNTPAEDRNIFLSFPVQLKPY